LQATCIAAGLSTKFYKKRCRHLQRMVYNRLRMKLIPNSRGMDMVNGQLRPLSAGRLLDRSFRLYRKHFVKLILLALVLYGPFYLLVNLLFDGFGMTGIAPWSDWLGDTKAAEDALSLGGMATMNEDAAVWKVVVLLLVLCPLFVNVCVPLFAAGMLNLVKADLLQEGELSLGHMLKAGLRRFWPMLGNMLLAQVLGVTVYFVLFIVLLIVGGIVAVSAGSLLFLGFTGSGSAAGVFLAVLLVVIGVGVAVAILYFVIRLMYFLPGVALGEVGVGFGQSWRLTRRSFWRLLVMYIVQMAVVYPLTLVLILLLPLLGNWTGSSIVVQLLNTVATIVMAPMWVLAYAVSYFDMKVRNEGLGLQELMQAAGIRVETATVVGAGGMTVGVQAVNEAAAGAAEAHGEGGPPPFLDLRKRDRDE